MAERDTGDRFAWVDYAKGICLVAVVGLYAATYVEKSAGDAGWMQYWVDFARPFRMPDFFLVAGLFLARTIDRPWRVYLDRKVVHFAYFFALWTTIYFVLRQTLMGDNPHGGTLWQEYLWWYVDPFHMLWFIEMLPVFFVVTRLLRRVPATVVLPLAAILQILDPETGWYQLDRFAERYVYFYAGYACAPLAFRLADWARERTTAAILAIIGWATVNAALVLNELSAEPGIGLVLGFAGAAAVMAVGSLLSCSRGMDWLRYLGRHSIVVFLAFFPVTLVASKALSQLEIIDDPGTQVLLVTMVSVAVPVIAHRLVRATPARYLFERPAWARLDRPRVPGAPAPVAALPEASAVKT